MNTLIIYAKKIGFLKPISNKISIMTAINIYNTMIKSHFEFGSTILPPARQHK